MKNLTTKKMAFCALFAALSAALSQISVPIGTVPINMVHISIFMSAGLLGAKYGALSQLVFVLMGACGLPVFSRFTGGMGKVMGETGGYIIAYIITALVAGIIIDRFGRKSIMWILIAMYTGWLITYIFGTVWYSYVMGTDFFAALLVCVVPFLIGDLIKSILSCILIKRLYPIFNKI